MPKRKDMIAILLVGSAISIAIGPLREIILSYLGDRRAEYQDMSSTFFYISFWLGMLVLLLEKRQSTMSHIDSRYSLAILSIIAMNLVTGGYSTRFIAAAFPSLIVAMGRWPSRPNSVITLLFIPYAGLQWLYWFRLL